MNFRNLDHDVVGNMCCCEFGQNHANKTIMCRATPQS